MFFLIVKEIVVEIPCFLPLPLFFLFMFWGIEGPTSLLLYDFSITWRISLGLFNAYLANKPLLHLVLREKL